ncbi:hypothetical protein [Streptococcus ovuberis]|uniref:Uncharacterized protein n=1 Tax=Streptococcus ovuberis TaxID=1936207 RepID=A0A7X6S051_9STRE|nr:hypothetical protein [Streptococcus ovuberis]NKZ19848.1 hypothetical protein [Streptococcus ovuberis]
MDKLHAEMERTVSKTIDNKLVDYQISLSDNFYTKYLSYYDCPYTKEVVKSHRKFFQDLSYYAIYQKLGEVTKISIQARLSELDTLVDISDNKDEFDTFFYKKFQFKLPEIPFEEEKLELSSFDLKLQQALNYNPKEDEGLRKRR